MSESDRIPPVPAVLRLVQMVMLGRWRATGDDLYREIVKLAEPKAGQHLLVSGCGEGTTAEWLAHRTGASVTGVDPSKEQIERADANRRKREESLNLVYQQAPPDDLPFEDAVFDVTVGEPAVASAADVARAVRELARVTKPMGTVVLLQPTWSSEIAASARELLVARLGLRPHLLVEWKQMLREAGVVEIQVQDWTTGAPATAGRTSGQTSRNSTPTAKLNWQEKIQIAGQELRRTGLRGARGAIERESALLRELSRERAIGFQLIKGVKWPHEKQG
jgi:SAM-dependent methyltransferase